MLIALLTTAFLIGVVVGGAIVMALLVTAARIYGSTGDTDGSDESDAEPATE